MKARIDRTMQSQVVLIAIGINADGRRQMLAVALVNRASRPNSGVQLRVRATGRGVY